MARITTRDTNFIKRLRTFTTGGKLLRGCLVCYSYAIFSGKQPDEAVIKAAMAVELAHAGLLIHDDVMDRDNTRRGQPAIHYQYELLAEQQGLADPHHFGTCMAVCVGNAAILFAFELLAHAGTDAATISAINLLFGYELANVCAGQMQDIYLEASSKPTSKKAVYEVMQTKTAAYSVALPLKMGAILAKKSEPILKELQALGLAAGTIFQIRDDELGVLGDAAKLGKPVGSDIKEGKKTLLYYYLFKLCSPGERAKLLSIFGNAGATLEDIGYVQSLIEQYNIPALLDKEIGRLQKTAYQHIEQLDVSHQSQAELKDLVNFCATRQA